MITRRFRLSVSIILLTLTAPLTMAQQTWIVDASGGGDFTDIPPAVSAAQDGDLILVRATGPYSGFTLDKGVIVKASTTPFALPFGESVTIQGVATGLLAGVSGVDMKETLSVSNCQAEIILESISIARNLLMTTDQTSLRIVDCTNTSVDNLAILPGPMECIAGPCQDSTASVEVTRSVVRLNDTYIEGPKGSSAIDLGADGFVGGAGMLTRSSVVILASPVIVGGEGGLGGGAPGFWATSGDGGPGIHVEKSFVTVLGLESQTIQGGEGGPTDPFGWNAPGSGGDGLHVEDHRAEISRVVTLGGANGSGVGAGAPEIGPVVRQDVMAVLDVTDLLRIGNNYTLDLDGIEPGTAFLVYSDVGGWWPLRAYVGPDLSALPGGMFGVLPLGRTDGAGDVSRTIQVSGDPMQVGQNWVFQMALFGDSGVKYLTNSATRIVGE